MHLTFKLNVDEAAVAAQTVADTGAAGALDLVNALDLAVADYNFTMDVLELAIQACLSDLEKDPSAVPADGAQRLAAMLQTAREKTLKYC